MEIVELDVNGRFIILYLKTPGEINFNVINVYVPTDPREQIDFINSFSKKIISLTNTSNLIIAGDWNATLDPLDKQGGLTCQLDLLTLLIKKYIYSCKSSEIHPGCSQFINQLKIQWKIEISS